MRLRKVNECRNRWVCRPAESSQTQICRPYSVELILDGFSTAVDPLLLRIGSREGILDCQRATAFDPAEMEWRDCMKIRILMSKIDYQRCRRAVLVSFRQNFDCCCKDIVSVSDGAADPTDCGTHSLFVIRMIPGSM